MDPKKVEVLVVGAGVSGLVAACSLREAGHNVLVVDKGRSVGGRMATRRVGAGLADHGAQYFTARTAAFEQQIDRWIEEGLVYLWAMGFSTGSLTPNDTVGHPRYAVRGGMNQLTKHMALGLDVEVDVRLDRIELADGRWHASSETQQYVADAVILTPPVPQSLALLDTGQVRLAPADRAALDKISYSPCIAAMFRFEGELTIPAPGAIQRPANTIPWIADNQQKGISPNEKVVTLHADPDYSRRYWDAPEVEILETMSGYLQPYMPPGTRLQESQIKRWRYSFPETLYEESALLAASLPTLAFGGDAFGGPRVEGAYLSGLAVAKSVTRSLQNRA
ncbi:FAD-dependent oxidoreductase [bacterium]|nr:FAD-dependent oxidoreductase [bacterium]